MRRILLKAKSDGTYIRLRAISREYRYPHEFWLNRDALWKYICSKNNEFVARDGYNYICLRRCDNEILVTLTYISVYTGGQINGRQDEFLISRLGFETFICYANAPGETYATLNLNVSVKPKIIVKDTHNLQLVAANPVYRRKFAKFMRDAFQWNSTAIELYDDFVPYSFFFREKRGDHYGMCGGVILHGQDDPVKAYYSIHT